MSHAGSPIALSRWIALRATFTNRRWVGSPSLGPQSHTCICKQTWHASSGRLFKPMIYLMPYRSTVLAVAMPQRWLDLIRGWKLGMPCHNGCGAARFLPQGSLTKFLDDYGVRPSWPIRLPRPIFDLRKTASEPSPPEAYVNYLSSRRHCQATASYCFSHFAALYTCHSFVKLQWETTRNRQSEQNVGVVSDIDLTRGGCRPRL